MIYIANKKTKEVLIQKKYPNARIIDITSKGNGIWSRLSPFYPHGGIPIPFSDNCYSMSVEGIWQGLKVFENYGIDVSKFKITNMEGIKRSVRKYGQVRGHQKGIDSKEILDYLTARKEIYLKTYKWVLENKVSDVINELVTMAEKQDIVLLDYNTNQDDIYTSMKPLSHAFLVKKHIEKEYPTIYDNLVIAPQQKKKMTNKKKHSDQQYIENSQLKLF